MENKNLKSLEDFNNEKRNGYFAENQHAYNGIACPNCGEELIDNQPNSILTSYPPQKSILCIKCNYYGFRIA